MPLLNKILFSSALVLSLLLWGNPAATQTKEKEETVSEEHPQEPREFIMNHMNRHRHRILLKKHTLEFAPFVGPILGETLPNSVFYGARTNFHFNERFALGVDGGFSEAGFEPFTLGTVINEGDRDSWFINGNLAYHFPTLVLASKKRLITTDVFVTGGGGIFNLSGNNEMAFNVGGGTKVYFNRWIVLRIDVRNYLIYTGPPYDRRLSSNALIMFGLSFFFPNTPPSSKISPYNIF